MFVCQSLEWAWQETGSLETGLLLLVKRAREGGVVLSQSLAGYQNQRLSLCHWKGRGEK